MSDASGAGVASVASQLLAFYREPARFRPYYIHGQQALLEGHVVLKLALGRFAAGWTRDLPAHDREELVHAARAFVRQVCLWERATHYQVLCLGGRAGPDSIKENYRLLMALIHPDRQEADAHEWPLNCAQRVNEAYATLSDENPRAAYDEMLLKARMSAPFEHISIDGPVEPAKRRSRGGHVRRAALVAVMLVGMYSVLAWWMGETPQHYSLLERAAALRAADGWMRNELPRFMDVKPVAAFDPIELVVPSRQPLRLASAYVPAVAAPQQGAAAAPAKPEPPVVPVPEPVTVAPLRLAQAPAAPAASTVPATPKAGPTSEDIELLVVQLVNAYERGSVDAMMSLFDTEDWGMWRGFRVRNAYTEFFRATRTRKLRMDKLSWKTSGASSHAQGGATVIAEYADGGARLERKVDIELDVSVRDGLAKITRLSLFPDAK